MDYRASVIYDCVDEQLHPLVPMIMKYCKEYNVDTYLIMAIFQFETKKYPSLIALKNLGNIRSEESEFVLPIQFDSIETSTELYIRLMRQVIERHKIYTVEDCKKLVRPLAPEWGDEVHYCYKMMLDLHGGMR